MRNIALVLVALCVVASGAAGQKTPIKLVMDKALSPDGGTLAFSWRGDIWTASSAGGAARRLTFHPSRDHSPRFSPDGEEIAFVSSRSGMGNQIFTMSAAGGRPKQVTKHTDGYQLLEWTADGNGFLVRANRDHYWRNGSRFFIQPRDGKSAPKLLFDAYGANGTMSPDGKTLLFQREGVRGFRKRYTGSQEGQIWSYSLDSGEFKELQGQGQGGARWPLWRSDSSSYVYVDQSQGAWNLNAASLATAGKSPLTRYEDDGVLSPVISRDGSTIVYTRLFDLYRLKAGKPEKIELWDEGDPTVEPTRRITLTRADYADFTDDAREIVFVSGGDLYVMDTELKEPVQITNTPEEERYVLFTPDHKASYFISDAGGQCDIWRARCTDETCYWWQNTEFTLEKVTDDAAVESGLRSFAKGTKLAYHRDRGDIMVRDIESGETQKVVSSWLFPTYDFSPDGKWIVYAMADDNYNDDIWIKPLDGSRKPFNLSCHPDDDLSPSWSPDGKKIAFVGRRWGTESDIVYVHLTKEADEETRRQRTMKKALDKMKGRKKKGAKKDEPKKAASKDAPKKDSADPVSGEWEGTVFGVPTNPAGQPFTLSLTLHKDGTVTGTTTSDGETSDIVNGTFDRATGKISFEIATEQGNVANTGTVSGGKATGTWSFMTFSGRWEATRTATGQSGGGDKPAAGGKKVDEKKDGKDDVEVRIDFDGILDRLRRVPNSGSRESSLTWSPDGKRLYFSGTSGGKSGMHYIEFPDSLRPKYWGSTRLGRGRWTPEKKWVGLSGGQPAVISSSNAATRYGFTVRGTEDVAAKHRAIFDQAWRTMRDRWYDERLGNNNWDAIRRKYIDAATTVDSGELSIVSNMMLGELNGSHLGFSFFGGGSGVRSPHQWSEVTGHLGCRYDDAWKGPGLKVKDVVVGSPAHREDSRIEAGEVILAIDGTTVDPGMDLAHVMTGRPQRDVKVRVKGADGEERTVTIRPTTYGSIRGLLYEAWLEHNRKLVEKLSNGKLGYLHIRAMSGTSLVKFDAELYRIGAGKDGIVIDVRENGGGSITDHLLTCLTQPTHAITRSRGGGEGYPHDRRIYATWDKPIAVLCNQNSFSNAEIFSHAVKTLKRGQVVGVPTAGGVISTGGAGLMGGAFVRLPFRGWYTLDGEDMELHGCEPHHVLWPHPGEMPAGKDRQLEKAVEVLTADVTAWKARPRVKLKKATER